VSYSSGFVLALAGAELTQALIAGATVVALIVLALCYGAMSRPIPGDHPPEQRGEPAAAQSDDVREPEPAAEKRRSSSPGFVLPLPSEVPPSTSTANSAASPAAQPSAAEPVAVARQPRPAEGTVNLSKSAVNGASALAGLPVESSSDAMSTSSLVIANGERAGEKIPLDGFSGGVCAIGRSDVPENQIVIRDDPKVSRMQHAIISAGTDGRYLIRDNNSANRVFVNEECIDSAPVPLNPGDKIRVGLTEFEYVKEPVS
jgi:hypothetical protein